MSFNPQYHTWSQETFATSGAAEYSDPYTYLILGGAAKLFPERVPYWSDGPWDTISGWSDTNGMNSTSGVQDDFVIFESTGLSGSSEGSFGNLNLMYGAASYTDVRGAAIDDAGRYVSGEFAAAVYTLTGEHSVNNTAPPSDSFKFTMQFKYRNDLPQVNEAAPFYMKSGQQNPDGTTSWQINQEEFNDTRGLTGFLSQGVLIDRGYDYAFVELSPVGTRLIGPGLSGYANPQMKANGGLKEVRISVDYPNVSIIHENGESIYAANGFTNKTTDPLPANLEPHISLGAFPFNTGNISYYDSVNTNRFDSYDADPYGRTGLAGFAGITYWDEFKILYNDYVTRSASGFISNWPTGQHHYIWTDPWYTSPDSQAYIGAYIKYNNQTGGTVTITPEIKYAEDSWVNYSGVSSVTIDGYGGNSVGLDLTAVPIKTGFGESAIRFRLDAYSYGGAVPEIDDITVFSEGPNNLVDVFPNWKESALPKEISWFINHTAYEDLIPPVHYQDSVYLHNESKIKDLSLNTKLPPNLANNMGGATGQVVGNTTYGSNAGGFEVAEDGIYGPCWKNHTLDRGVDGVFMGTISYPLMSAGSGVFFGEKLDRLDLYGSNDIWTGYSGEALVELSTPTYTDSKTFADSYAQKIVVTNYESDNTLVHSRLGYPSHDYGALSGLDIGFITTGLTVGKDYSSENRLALFSGYIHIEAGPGVVATIHEGDLRYQYYLPGENYRQPNPFSVAAPISQSNPDTPLDISFGVLPRTSKPYLSQTEQNRYGDYWVDKIQKNRSDIFTLINLTGKFVDLSYAEYYHEVDPRIPNDLDPNAFDVDGYSGLDRSSTLFEGWFRPLGVANSQTGYSESVLFEVYTPENTSVKTRVVLNTSGEIRAEIPLSVHLESYGQSGASYVDVGYDSGPNRIISTGDFNTNLNPFHLVSNNKSITWGDWNHIGFALDTRSIGDMVQTGNQPVYPNYSGHTLHGSRSSKLYLELNGEVVDSIDVGLNPYSGGITGFQPNELGTSNPTQEVYVNSWPRIPRAYRSDTDSNSSASQGYHIKIGENVLLDFDHVRFGMRDSVCAKSALGTLGSKNTPPQFIFGDSPKVPEPIHIASGGVSHFEMAHIYRFDHLSDYVGWDEGFAPQHMLFKNAKYYKTGDILHSFGIKAGDMFFEYDTGPKGRPAIRLGPGAVGVVPFGSFDERIYNGPETLSLFNGTLETFIENTITNSTTLYSGDAAKNNNAFNKDITPWSTDLGQEHERSTSNGIVRIGSFVKFNQIPPVNMLGDILNFNELDYMSDYYDKPDGNNFVDGHDDHYDVACMYLGISGYSNEDVPGSERSGVLVCGTRANNVDNVNTISARPVGPFYGNTVLYTNTWYHVGLEAKTRSGEGYLQMLLNGETEDITVCTFDPFGDLTSITGGCGVGYRGFLGLDAGKASIELIQSYGQRARSCYRIGGHVPNVKKEAASTSSHLYRHMDTSYSELVIGYSLPNVYGGPDSSSWDWSRLASTNGNVYTGLGDQAFANAGASIGPIYATGTPLTGTLYYPEVTYGSAGSQVLWAGINMGHDIEGPGFKGLSIFDDAVFINAPSYYATFSEDNAQNVIGSDDSPIQIGTVVPNNGVNLGVINAKEWTTENVLTNFDLSDQNYSNITNLLFGDFDVKDFKTSNGVGDSYVETLAPQVDSTDVRLSSVNVWGPAGVQDVTAFYMHLVGGNEKEVYIQGAESHTVCIQDGSATETNTGRYKAFYSNKDKVYESIICRDADGKDIPYEDFPYSLITVPYDSTATGATGDLIFGYQSGAPTGQFLEDNRFTTILISSQQSIGKTVFIHYSSANKKTNELNLNDSEIYNPIPIMRQDDYGEVYAMSGEQARPECSFSLVPDSSAINMYNTVVWGANLSGWAQQP